MGGDKILRAYKYRIYPTKEQEKYLTKVFGCIRFIYQKYHWRENLWTSAEEKRPFWQHSSICPDIPHRAFWRWAHAASWRV